MEPLQYCQNIWSLKCPNAFKDLFVADHENPLLLDELGKVIWKLPLSFECVDNLTIDTHGRIAEKLFKIIQLKQKKQELQIYSIVINKIIIIDRTTDLIKPLQSQKTYGGILQEQLGYKVSVKILNDQIGEELKSIDYRKLGQTFRTKIQELTEIKSNMYKQTIHETYINRQEIYDAVTIKPLLDKHILLADLHITPIVTRLYFKSKLDVENNIITRNISFESGTDGFIDYVYSVMGGVSMEAVVRLICLYSLSIGFSQKELDRIRQDLIQEYGYKKIFLLLLNLSTLHLLTNTNQKIEPEEKSNNLVNKITKQVKKLTDDDIHKPNSYFDILSQSNLTRNSLVYVIGGITPDELGELEKLRLETDFCLLATDIITGDQFINIII